ncbi:MAG: flagellin [Chloroflexi bacterium]|nr:flagellin [Chloroflexota bacterium]
MPIYINTNVAAMNAQRNLGVTNAKMSRALERLSSGLRVNRAADDAAGLAISEKMRAQIRGLNQGLRNAQDGISLIQTAEGALNEVHAILQRTRELTTQAGSTTLSTADRTALGEEILTLRNEIDNIATRTRFNGLDLLTGALSVQTTSTIADLSDTSTNADSASVTIDIANAQAGVTYTASAAAGVVTLTNGATNVSQAVTAVAVTQGSSQELNFSALGVKLTIQENATVYADGLTATEVGVSLAAKTIVTTGTGSATFRVGDQTGDNVSVSFSDMQAAALGSGGVNDIADLVTDNLSVSTVAKSNTLLNAVDAAIGQVSNFRARLGAAQNQMESAVNSLGVAVENLGASESRIRDADIAQVSSELVTRQIMQQAGVAVLAQSNAAPQSALSLIG